MQSYDPQDMNFAKSHMKSWTEEQMAKEYDRLAGAYMALRHEHISALVDQDNNEKNARRQVVDSRQSLANGAQMLLWNSEAASEASKAIAGRICQPSIWTDPQTQTQCAGKAPGSFTPQEAQTILNFLQGRVHSRLERRHNGSYRREARRIRHRRDYCYARVQSTWR